MKPALLFGLVSTCLMFGVAQGHDLELSSCRTLDNVKIPAAAIGLVTQGAVVSGSQAIDETSGPYCLVDGEVRSVDSQAQSIKWQMAFPIHWNGNSVQLGGGGLDGRVVSPLEPNGIVAPTNLIARGYLVLGSDSGHEGVDDASFALNDEQLRNYGGDQVKKTLDVAIYLAKVLYGAVPRHRYFVGGSAGGRESFTAVQKFPGDYDAILSFFPGQELMPLTLKFLVVRRAMQANNGAGRIGPREADFIEKAELAACDKDDGIADGIIANPRSCKFDVASLLCANAAASRDACLSQAQVDVLRLMHTQQDLPIAMANGHSLAPYDVGAATGNFYASTGPVADFVRYFILHDANADASSLDPYRPGKLRERIEALSSAYDRISDHVDSYVAKGGKWIIVHGLADELVPSEHSINYYNKLVARYGQAKTNDFLRLYLIPGYAHGHGAPFDANYGPFFDALEAWVDGNRPPGTLTVIDREPRGHGRTRPACVYPALPTYKSGEADDARSFICAVDSSVAERVKH